MNAGPDFSIGVIDPSDKGEHEMNAGSNLSIGVTDSVDKGENKMNAGPLSRSN